jgi:hypothetical protein
MKALCIDYNEGKAVKKEANSIIKEIARRAEASWETEYFKDKNDPWNYKIDYCALENGIYVDYRNLPYRGFDIDWI